MFHFNLTFGGITMSEILIDQVDGLSRISDKINYLSSCVEDDNDISLGLSAILFDISLEVGTISNRILEHLKTQ